MSATFSTIKNKNRGTTLVEMILYVVLLVFVMTVIVQMLISIGGVYRNIKITRELESSGTIAMEQMLREIRSASSVKISGSTFGTSPGSITLSGFDESQNPYEVVFSVDSGVLKISKNGSSPVSLTSFPASVSSLIFTHVITSTYEGVQIKLEVFGTAGSVSKTAGFQSFTVLRGAY
ncbi:MAG: hypothetical protein AAB446_03365 [Patescibacteria group bacterium]